MAAMRGDGGCNRTALAAIIACLATHRPSIVLRLRLHFSNVCAYEVPWGDPEEK